MNKIISISAPFKCTIVLLNTVATPREKKEIDLLDIDSIMLTPQTDRVGQLQFIDSALAKLDEELDEEHSHKRQKSDSNGNQILEVTGINLLP